MAGKSLKELDYAISFDINDNGLTKALNVEQQIDKGLLGMAKSAEKVDNNISKMASNAGKAKSSAGGVAEALNTTSTNAQKASKNTDSINNSLGKAKSSASGVAEAFKNMESKLTGNVGVADKLNDSVKKIAITLGTGLAIKDGVTGFTDFEQGAASVHATLGEISNKDMQNIKKNAIDLSNEFGVASTEILKLQENIASAGYESNDLLKLTRPSSLLASAGRIGNDESAELLAGTLKSYHLGATEALHVADVYASAAAKTSAQVKDMKEAMAYAAPIGFQYGQSLEETAAAMGVMGDQMIKGSMAGTTYRSVFSNLAKPSKEASDLMQITGFSAYDTSGKMKHLSGIIGDLKIATSKMDNEMKNYYLTTIFGQESLSGVLALIGTGPDKINTLTQEFKTHNGVAQEMANIQNDTLGKSFDRFKNKIKNTFITNIDDSELGKTLKDFFNFLSDKIPKVGNEIDYALKKAKEFGGFVKDNWTTILPIVEGVAGAFVAFKAVNGAMSIVKDFGKALKFLGTPAGGIFLVVAAVAALVGGIIYAYNTNEKFRNSINNLIVKFGEFYAFLQTYILPVLSVGFQGIWETIKNVWGDITQILSGVAEILGGVIDFVVGVFTGDWDKAWGGIKGIFTGVWDVISGTFKGFKDTIVGGLGTIIDMALKALKIFNDTNNAKPGDNSYLAWKAGVPESLKGTPKTMEQKSAQRAGKSGYASGTNYATPGMHLVGENGPELLMFGGGEKVIPAGATSSILNNSSDQYINSGKKVSDNIASGIDLEENTVIKSLNNVVNTIKDTLSVFVQQSTTYGQSIINQIAQGVTDSGVNLTTVVQSLTDKVVTTFKEGFGIHSPSRIMYSIGSFLMQGLVNGMSDKDVNGFLQDKIGSMIAVSTSAMGGNVSAWLTSALAATGTPLDWLPGLLKLVSAESGGDPNNWNPQSVGGEHATGLLQTLPSTFSEFMQPGMSNILNPVDNAASAINYIKSRYGSVYNTPLFRGGPYVGYANGTDNATPGLHLVGERGPEILAFNGGEKVLDNDKSKQIFNQSKPYASSNGSSAVIQSTPNIEINIQESKDAKTTAMEVEKILRKLFPQLFDKEMVKIGIQMGYTPIVES
ncbi:phage tail tape measure protein [Clostridium magnum]|uniref:phage tail tape measure protein n=1 Tax=Clostridium magnum TaxID=33954 RepID=UPI00091F3227|nr:phage tail tape measure protein [Clostridium magnum]SHJ28354.1 phage tail tape measure protein, TP901 family, core region [Clostridium magnum DSM 2767]